MEVCSSAISGRAALIPAGYISATNDRQIGLKYKSDGRTLCSTWPSFRLYLINDNNGYKM